MALDRCMRNNLISASVNRMKKKGQATTTRVEGETPGSRDFRIKVNYTLLDDTFVLPKAEDLEGGGQKGTLWKEITPKKKTKAQSDEEKFEPMSVNRKIWKLNQGRCTNDVCYIY